MADETRTDIELGDDSLLVTEIAPADRVLITKEDAGQQQRSITFDDFKKAIPYLGENLLLGTGVPIEVGVESKAVPFSTGFLEQGETYVVSCVDQSTGGGAFDLQLLTRNGPTPNQPISPGVPFIAAGRDDWEYVLVKKKSGSSGNPVCANLKLERGTVVTPWCPNPTETALIPSYSLTEQICPGEFWFGPDGVKRQVYIRSFVGTTPTGTAIGNRSMVLAGNGASIKDVKIVYGAMETGSTDSYQQTVEPNITTRTGEEGYNDRFFWNVTQYHPDRLILYYSNANLDGRRFSVTVKYTKK